MVRLTARLKPQTGPRVLSLWRGLVPQCRTMGDIVSEVAENHQLRIRDILGSRCDRAAATARHEAIQIMAEELRADSTEIAYFLGNRDPSTVRHALRKARSRQTEGLAVE